MFRRKYIQEGEQTELTPLVMEHVGKIRENKSKMSYRGIPVDARSVSLATYRTCDHIFNLPYISGWREGADKENLKLKNSVFRKRTLNEVLDKGPFPTCSDAGLLFRGLMIAQEFPVAYIEAFHEDFIFGRAFHGHVLGRVFYNGKSVLVDPGKTPRFYAYEESLFKEKRYVLFDEGLDSWDVGIRGYGDMIDLRKKNLRGLRKKHWDLCEATTNLITSP